MADRMAALLVRQWTTTDDADSPSTSGTSATAGSPSTSSRPPPSPRPNQVLASSARTGDSRSSVMKSDGVAETSPSTTSFFVGAVVTEDVAVDPATTSTTAVSDTSSGRGSASPDTRPSSRGKSRFTKILRPLRRTRSAGCSDDFLELQKTTSVQQVADELLRHYSFPGSSIL